MCGQCEHRTRPEAFPLCPGCWALRATEVKVNAPGSGTRLQTLGLVLGCVSLLPQPLLQVGSLVINIIALVRAKEPPASRVRWKPVLGLCLTLVGVIIDCVLLFLAFSHSGS